MKNIFNLLIVAGIILIIGTAGASDSEAISIAQTASQLVFALKLIVSGAFLKRAFAFAKRLAKRRIYMRTKNRELKSNAAYL